MSFLSFLTPKDAYIEANGIRIANIQRYKINTCRDTYPINVFGYSNPIKILNGNLIYKINLSRISILNSEYMDPVEFFSLCDFNLVIVQNKLHIIFTECQWSSIAENLDINSPMIQSVSLISSKKFTFYLENNI